MRVNPVTTGQEMSPQLWEKLALGHTRYGELLDFLYEVRSFTDKVLLRVQAFLRPSAQVVSNSISRVESVIEY